MFDYKLRFETEQHADQVLAQYEQDLHNIAVVRIGTLYQPSETNQTDEEGLPIFDSVALDGYHVDVRSREQIDFADYVVVPKKPRHEIAN